MVESIESGHGGWACRCGQVTEDGHWRRPSCPRGIMLSWNSGTDEVVRHTIGLDQRADLQASLPVTGE